MAAIRALLFDKDGTLVDIVRTLVPAFDAILRALAGGSPDGLARLTAAVRFDLEAGRILPGSPIARATPAELAACVAPALGVPNDTALVIRLNTLLARERARHLTIRAGALPLFDWVKSRGYKLGVSTNAAANHAREELDQLELVHHLDFLAGFNSGFGAKPGAGHVLAFAAAVEVLPTSILCVGDSPLDMLAARAAGAIPVGILGGAATADELRPLADHIVGDLAEIPALVERLSAA